MSRIAIKIPQALADPQMWGEFYYAYALKRSLNALEERVTVLFREHREVPVEREIVLLGLGMHDYCPRSRVSIAWLISHPDKNDRRVLSRYTKAFVSSKHLARQWGFEYLGQCFDRTVHYAAPPPEEGGRDDDKRNDVVFVGNGRPGDRTDLIHLLNDGIDDFHVWGHYHPRYIRNAHGHISWFKAADLFRQARIVIGHNTARAREDGIANDRLFAAINCGAFVLSDAIRGIDSIFPELVVYHHPQEAVELARYYLDHPAKRRLIEKRCFDRNRGEHFDARAVKIRAAFQRNTG